MKSSKGKLIGALIGMCASGGVLFYGLSSMEGGPLSFNDGVVSALDEVTEDEPTSEVPDFAVIASGSGSSSTGATEASQAPSGKLQKPAAVQHPVAAVTGTAGPDWPGLFQQLMDREEAMRAVPEVAPVADESLIALPDPLVVVMDAEDALIDEMIDDTEDGEGDEPLEPADDEPVVAPVNPFDALAGRSLQGLLSRGGEGLALLDGQLLRVGDVLPSSAWVITAVQRDRIELLYQPANPSLTMDAPDVLADDGSEPINPPAITAELLLAPMTSGPGPQAAQAPATAPAAVPATEPVTVPAAQ